MVGCAESSREKVASWKEGKEILSNGYNSIGQNRQGWHMCEESLRYKAAMFNEFLDS